MCESKLKSTKTSEIFQFKISSFLCNLVPYYCQVRIIKPKIIWMIFYAAVIASERTLFFSVFTPEASRRSETRRSNSTKGPMFNASIMRLREREREGGRRISIPRHARLSEQGGA